MGRTSDARERLIKAAIELVYTRGYNAVGVKEICEQAGVNKGSFYYFFPSKRDLMLAALDAQWETYQREFLEPTLAEDISPLEKLQRLLQRASQASMAHHGQIQGCPFGNVAVELSTQDEAVRRKLQDIFEEWTNRFEQLLQEAVTAGHLPPIDTRATAQAILAYVEGVAVIAKTYNDPDLVERLAPGITHLATAPAVQSPH